MKSYKIGKFIVFIGIAISIIFLMNFYIENLDKFIGGLIVLYALDNVVRYFDKENERKSLTMCQAIVQFLLGTCTIFAFEQLETICIIWAVWSIMREAGELEECYELFKERIPFFLSLIESVVAIVFSIILINNPSEQHAKTHMILLIVELCTTVLLPQCRKLYLKFVEKRKTNTAENE